jgi:hypothetical protein
VILDRALGRDGEEVLGHEQRHERHHAEVGLQVGERPPHLGILERGGLQQRQLVLERRLLERVGSRALLVGCAIDRDHLFAALEQRFQHRLAERLLPDQRDPHVSHLLASAFPRP